jgi:cytochrome b561
MGVSCKTEFSMSPQKSRVIDRILHWFSAGAIIFLLFDIGFKVHTVDYRIKGAVQHKQDAIELHLLVALLLFTVLLARIVWYRYLLDKSYWLKYESPKHKIATRLAHFSFYGILFLLMLSGVVMVLNYEHPLNILGLINLSESNVVRAVFYDAHNWHLYFESAVYFLIFVHLAGVMYSRR